LGPGTAPYGFYSPWRPKINRRSPHRKPTTALLRAPLRAPCVPASGPPLHRSTRSAAAATFAICHSLAFTGKGNSTYWRGAALIEGSRTFPRSGLPVLGVMLRILGRRSGCAGGWELAVCRRNRRLSGRRRSVVCGFRRIFSSPQARFGRVGMYFTKKQGVSDGFAGGRLLPQHNGLPWTALGAAPATETDVALPAQPK